MTHLKRRVVRMMFMVVVAFLVCWLPYQILTVSKGAFIDDTDHFHSQQAKKVCLSANNIVLETNVECMYIPV